jgi:hypothetical protein
MVACVPWNRWCNCVSANRSAWAPCWPSRSAPASASSPASRNWASCSRRPAPALSPTLASNLGAYKLSVLDLADRHRTALAQHESQMDQTRLALHEAFRRREAVAQLHGRRLEEGERALHVAERKRTDDIAQTVWLRGRA